MNYSSEIERLALTFFVAMDSFDEDNDFTLIGVRGSSISARWMEILLVRITGPPFSAIFFTGVLGGDDECLQPMAALTFALARCEDIHRRRTTATLAMNETTNGSEGKYTLGSIRASKRV